VVLLLPAAAETKTELTIKNTQDISFIITAPALSAQ